MDGHGESAGSTEASAPSYPLRAHGSRDAELSRWLWLVKWLLAIPHVIVLAFLWAAFVVMTVVAFFAILFTGRYPRSIFDFNVGVVRWTWRVAFYTYGALGTDRYPPFSLDDDPEYPARLEVEYPERLSRGLVLVKWWLLAIPHYIVVAFFVGAGWIMWSDEPGLFAVGLINVLVLIAAVVLLFTARYPNGIFDLVLGLDRWTLRVLAYAALMTDTYPPFRLDTGGPEPTWPEEPVAAPEAAALVEAPARRWSAGRVVSIVIGSILALVSLGLLAGGGTLVVIDQTQRDSDGFLMSPSERLSTGTYALVSETLDVDVAAPDWVVDELLGTLRIRAETDPGVPLFLGIAPEDEGDAYLRGVGHAVVTGFAADPDYETTRGGPPATPPAEQTFWVAETSRAGEQTLDWEVEDGSWLIVAMNADGSRGVEAEVSVGAELDALLWIGIVLLAIGLVLALAAAGLVYLGVRRPRAEPA